MNTYETHKMKDPRIPFICEIATCTVRFPGTEYNWHANIEIIAAIEGNGYVAVGDDRIPITEGEVVVINPNRLHSFATTGKPFRYIYLIIDNSFLIANYFDTNRLYFKGVIRDTVLYGLICELARYRFAEDAPMRIQHIRTLGLEISLLLGEKYAVSEEELKSESHLLACIKQAIGYLRAESHRDISLDEISAFVGLSKYYFAREFRRITGFSFVSYLNLLRCEKAKELLSSGMSAGDVCRASGFGSPSYFSQTFRAYTGVTPSAYRRGHRGAKESFLEKGTPMEK